MSNEIQKEHMRQCLNAAMAVWDFCDKMAKDLDAPGDEDYVEVQIESLKEILVPFFPTFEVTDTKLLEVIDRLDYSLGQYGPSSCGCFVFAHMLDHAFDLEHAAAGHTAH